MATATANKKPAKSTAKPVDQAPEKAPQQVYDDTVARALMIHDASLVAGKGSSVSRAGLRAIAHGHGSTSEQPSDWNAEAKRIADAQVEAFKADIYRQIDQCTIVAESLVEAESIEKQGGIGGFTLTAYGFAAGRRFAAAVVRVMLAGERLGKRIR